MQHEDSELLFIKHHSNLQKLSAKQLQAIKEDQLTIVDEIVAQKQIIIDSIVALQEKFDISNCQPSTKESLQKLLTQINANEKESQQIVGGRCTDIRIKMLAIRKEANIQEAYDGDSSPNQGIFFNVRR